MYNFSLYHQKLQKILDHVSGEINSLRTSKASASLLDTVRVEAYGTQMAVNELGNISAPDANMIIVDPWDKSLIEEVVKGINKAGLNLNPVVDKQIIRIVIPPLTQERRQELVRQLRQKAESARAMMRSVRIDTKNEIDSQEGQAGVSEDDIHRELLELDKIMESYEAQLTQLVTTKEKDLLSI
ncbi:MAG TPA: ribosome recycling factor [Candidatus Woesebacteria bacterium]|nr:ribosome recycling factor [Candidatus Woesebacteria bacterium]